MFLTRLHQVKAFVLDIDGVLTDATVHVTETGEQLRRFNVRDGYAIQLAIKRGFKICAISGGKSQGALLRLNTLGMTDVYLGIAKKIDTYNKFIQDNAFSPEEILYMGDDIPDLPVMQLAGVPVCPADAVEEVKAISMYISPKGGGEGCVRDVIEKVLKVQGKWFDPNPMAGDSTIVSS